MSLQRLFSELEAAIFRPCVRDGEIFQDVNTSAMDKHFHLVYQPQFEISSGRMVGLEALLRLDAGNFPDVSPAVFVPLMEHGRLISKVGEWVFATVCRQRREWHDNQILPSYCRVAINVSACQFSDADLVGKLNALMQLYDISASMVEIEITESALLENTEHTRKTLGKLRGNGITLSVDDFGTGHASLKYLRQFSVDVMKIDRGYIENIATNRGDKAIVSALIKLAHSLDLRVIAEGVESVSQLAVLRGLGCDMAQGYLFSRPLKTQRVSEFVYKWRRVKSSSWTDFASIPSG